MVMSAEINSLYIYHITLNALNYPFQFTNNYFGVINSNCCHMQKVKKNKQIERERENRNRKRDYVTSKWNKAIAVELKDTPLIMH